ncbi:MAG TPA: NUDIX hydrolase, partial [Terriglobales bacterium]|nr:NUDIX hydrolase [Terriglobales bacterium]
ESADPRAFPRHPLVGVGVVVRRGDEILLVERGHPPMEGLWSVPGGAVELGEATQAAAAREVLEETGIAVAVDRLLTVVDRLHRDPDGRIHYHYVLVEYEAHPLDPRAEPRASSDARRARWVPLADTPNYRLVPNLDEILALVRR